MGTQAGSSGILLLDSEIAILKRVTHPHIIELIEVFETSKVPSYISPKSEVEAFNSALLHGDGAVPGRDTAVIGLA